MSHDLTAEYDGLAVEHGRHMAAGKTERAEAVRGELARVGSLIEAQAAAHTAEAERHENEGRDVPAARARIRARELREHLETAAQSLPLEQAAPSRKRTGGSA